MIKKLQQKVILSAENKIYKWSKKWGKKISLDLPYFIKNGFWVMIRQVIGAVSGLILSIAFARLATQEMFGQYQVVLAVLSIVSIVSIPGLTIALTRSIARGCDGDYKRVIRIRFLWSLLGVPVLLGVGGYYYIFQSQAIGTALIISSIFFPFLYSANTWDGFLQGKSLFNIAAKYSAIQAIIGTVVTIGVIFFNQSNLILVVIIYLISYTFFNMSYYFMSSKYIKNEKVSKGTVVYGLFLNKAGLLGGVVEQIDKIIIGIFNLELLAVYFIAIKIIDMIKIFSKSFFSILLPKFSKNKIKIHRWQFLVLLSCGLVVSVFLFIFAESIIVFLYTEKFIESVEIFKYLVFVVPLFFINSVLGYKIFSEKHRNKIIGINFTSPLITITIASLAFWVTGNIVVFVLTKVYTRQIINFIFMIAKRN